MSIFNLDNVSDEIKTSLDQHMAKNWRFLFTPETKNSSVQCRCIDPSHHRSNVGYRARVIGIACFSDGDSLEEASKRIREALRLHIYSLMLDGKDIPDPETIWKGVEYSVNLKTGQILIV